MGAAFTSSNVTLFITNLRLLDLDVRSDWPGITTATFSTKDAQQNQKNRVRCAEWALYQLFALWDVEETRNVCIFMRLEFIFYYVIANLGISRNYNHFSRLSNPSSH